MRKRIAVGAVGAVAALMLVSASGASAATEFGSHCTGNRAESNATYAVVQLSEGGVSTAAPISGVITSWKVNLTSVPFTIGQQLKVFRPTASSSQFQVVGESAMENVGSGANTFATRIPIQAGDHIGLFGTGAFGALFCQETPESEAPGDSAGLSLGNPTVGSTATVSPFEAPAQVPVAAVVEPDADGDGYGDETQDKCPQSAATQAPCPTVVLKTSASAKGTFVTVVVTSTVQASVTVAGKVKLGKGKAAKLNGGTQVVAPGALAKFTVPFTGKLKAALKKLGRKQKLKLKLTASAPNVIGAPSVSKATVAVAGQAKPKPSKKKN